MFRTALDFESFKAADELQRRMQKIKDELYVDIYNDSEKEGILKKLNGITKIMEN
jgi:hypothetical protein